VTPPRRRTLAVALAAAGVALLAVALAAEPRESLYPCPVTTHHVLLTVTVWSDGTVDMSDPLDLDARAARRLADRLEAQEDGERAARRAEAARRRRAELQRRDARARSSQLDTETRNATAPRAQSDPPGQPRQCAAIAKSTGQRCRKNAMPGSLYCRWHQPDTPN